MLVVGVGASVLEMSGASGACAPPGKRHLAEMRAGHQFDVYPSWARARHIGSESRAPHGREQDRNSLRPLIKRYPRPLRLLRENGLMPCQGAITAAAR